MVLLSRRWISDWVRTDIGGGVLVRHTAAFSLKPVPIETKQHPVRRQLEANELEELKKLRESDPVKNSVQKLAKKYSIPPMQVMELVSAPAEHKERLREELEARNAKIDIESWKQKQLEREREYVQALKEDLTRGRPIYETYPAQLDPRVSFDDEYVTKAGEVRNREKLKPHNWLPKPTVKKEHASKKQKKQ